MINPKLRRTLARITLPFFLLWSLWIPRQAYAFVPASVYGSFVATQGGIAAAGGGGGAVAAGGFSAFGAGAAAFGIGLALGYFAVDYFVGDHYETQRIPLTSDPAKQVPPPTAADPGELVAKWAGCAAVFNTWGEACSSMATGSCQTCDGAYHCQVVTNAQPTCTIKRLYSNNAVAAQFNVTINPAPSACADGYTLLNGVCALTDPRAAKPDHACDYARSGATLSMINDPDCAGLDVVCTSSGCVVVSADAAGNPRRVKITPTADGGSVVQIDEQTVVGGQTQVGTTTVTVGPGGAVTGTSGSVNPGTVPTDGTDPITNPNEQTQIQFPTDYARTGEAASAATQIVQAVSPKLEQLHTDNIQTQTKLDTLHDDLTKTEASTDPEAPLPSDMPWVGTTFASLTAWTVPGHVAVCPTYDLDLSSVLGAGKVFTFDAHCGLLNDQQNNMRLASLTAWLILSLFIVLRA